MPGSGDPFYSIRHQHTKSWSDTYKGFGMMDKDIDALIERSEAALDVEENIKLVKQIQLECMKKFTTSYTIYTQNRNTALSKKMQNLELTLAVPNPQHEVWVKTG